jgi:hypothetical protein
MRAYLLKPDLSGALPTESDTRIVQQSPSSTLLGVSLWLNWFVV